jgi:YidC/Oxa1 family membrane protein insertase
MEKNAILAIVLSVLVLLAWQMVFVAPQQEKMQEEMARQEKQPAEESSPVSVEQPQDVPVSVEGFLPSSDMSQRQQNENAEEILVDTPLIHAAISTQGARIMTWQILAHKNKEGGPVELVSDDARRRGQYPLEVFTGDTVVDEELNTGLYQSSVKSLQLQQGDEPVTFSLSYKMRNGITFTKEFRFYPDSYKVDVAITSSDSALENKVISVVWGPGLGKDLGTSTRFVPGVVSKTSEKKPVRDAAKKIDGLMTHQNVRWAAIDQKYFTVALFAGSTNNTLSVNKIPFQTQEEEKKIEPVRQLLIGLTQPVSSGTCQLSFYAGPKERNELAKAYDGFELLIDYGFFSFIAQPLAQFMTFLYTYVGNYGLVIICLTILIKILFYPLTHKSYSSMKKMQDLQPHMNALREKYKKDTQKLNQEMMKLYKEKGVNPMGGCLPMLLQIPVFFALYQTLSQSIELRGAAFLWITDLSAPETLFFRPLVLMMGVSMFFQQSMTPTAADNKQAQMFKFMPILFTAMFWNFPSGLVLYWFMNNFLTIGQQYLINKGGLRPSKKSENDSQETTSKSRKRQKKAN